MEKTMTKSEEFIKLCQSYDVDPDAVPEITSFEKACEFKKIDPATCLPDVSMLPSEFQQALISTAKMYIVAQALNQDERGEEWKPDWNKSEERKWLPWFDMEVDKNNPSGFRFHDSHFDRVYTYSTGGSRLCYRNSDICEFAGKHFLSLYKEMMVFSK
jgi:hypothetical protein